MKPEQEQPAAPSVEDQQKAAEVAQAGGEAAAEAVQEGRTAAEASSAAQQAMRQRADDVKLALSDEEIEKISSAMVEPLVSGIIGGMEARGVFEPPPEPVTPPPTTAPPAPAEGPAAPEMEKPRKKTFAARFLGVD